MTRCGKLTALALTLMACADAPVSDARTSDSVASAASDARLQERAVRARLDAYTKAARAVDANATAAIFTATGTLFEPGIAPIVTRDSIRAFMQSFPGVQVDSATAVADTIEVFGRTAIVWGSFFERLRFPGQPESAQHGRFVMEWRQEPDSVWYLHRYYRVPLPPDWKPPSR